MYIVSDAPKSQEDFSKVNSVREYIKSITGFLQVITIERSKNMGSQNSIFSMIKYIFNRYETLIFLEDDNYVSKNFLSFMNDSLEKYKDVRSIFSVSGYNYPISISKISVGTIYSYPGFSAWGVGLWKQKWNTISWQIDYSEMQIHLKQNAGKIKSILGYKVFECIQKMCRERSFYIDAYICYNLYLTDRKSIFPVLSKVRNYGHDGLGEHGKITSQYSNQSIDEGTRYILPKQIPKNKELEKLVREYFNVPLVFKIKAFIKSIFIPNRIKRRISGKI